ncbi:MAG: ATP-grasp domain-containing protein [Coriobacteriia bacterium]|nr:ATP-grasp domain-containing protein [Coriobacteriia bacterium]
MFILEEPYVSRLLALTAVRLGVPVLSTPMARHALGSRYPLADDVEFAAAFGASAHPRLYANSENAIGWIADHLGSSGLSDRIDVFKDKVRFRELIADLYPDYCFEGLSLQQLADFDPASLRAPFVVKPSVGFFSMGVHVVQSAAAWPDVVAKIHSEAREFEDLYPEKVIGLDRFVVEEVITGEEFAVDAYFDSEGQPVVLNILGHLFASPDDVSDRVYYTSVELIERWLEPFTAFLAEVGRRADLADFPVHAELRVDDDGRIAPIEINPMRFAGWCVTDLAHHAYDINSYEFFIEGLVPEWDAVFEGRRDRVYAVVIADIPATVDRSAIESVDYEALEARFTRPLEVRRVDYWRYPVLGFVFVELAANDLSEVYEMLGADLTTYLRMR